GAINLHSSIDPHGIHLLNQVERTHLFPVLEEGFRNVYLHSKASDLWFSIYCKNDGVIISLRDNGIGFEYPLVPCKTGIGLKTMEYRLLKIGASLSLESTSKKGTTLKIYFSKTNQSCKKAP